MAVKSRTTTNNVAGQNQTDGDGQHQLEKMVAHASFLGDESALYIGLPWTLERAHLQNRLKQMVKSDF